MKLNQSGYSLIEIMMAVGLSSFLLFIAMSQNVSITQSQFRYIRRSNLAQDALTITNYFGHEIGQIGGASVRPWMSAFLENNCNARGPFPACNGSDRLTLTASNVPAQECLITGLPLPGVLQINSAPTCCLDSSYLSKHFMLTSGNSYAQVFSTNVDTASCRLTFVNGQASANNSFPAFINWSGGTLTKVTVKTIYWDSIANQAKQFTDFNNNGVMDTGEMNILADQVLDLQFSLGLDINGDGNLIDNGTNADNYLYNSAGEAYGAGVFLNATPSQLKMIKVAIVTGVPAGAGGPPTMHTVQILDGPARTLTQWDSRKAILKFAPRNDFLYH